MLISTGIMSAPFSLVASLNLLTKSPILTPCWPSAGPIGGAGLALPAGICNFTTVFIFFAIILYFFHLQIIYFYGSFSAKHCYQNFNLAFLFIYGVYRSLKIFKRPVIYSYHIAHLHVHLVFRLGHAHSLKKRIHLFFVQRNRSRSRAHESSNSRSVPYDIPGIVSDDHIHQNITRVYSFLNRFSFPADYFYLFLRGNDGAENLVFHAQRFNSLLQISDHGILIAGVSVDGVPVSSGLDFLLCHILQHEFSQ